MDFKRSHKHAFEKEEVYPADSVSNVGSEDRSRVGDLWEGDDSQTVVIEAKDLKATEKYFATVKDAIQIVPIKGVETDEAEEPEISASRFQYRREMVKLPLAKNHISVIEDVWNSKKLDSIPLSSRAVAAKYKIIEKDFDKYLKPSQLDMFLKHDLARLVPVLSQASLS